MSLRTILVKGRPYVTYTEVAEELEDLRAKLRKACGYLREVGDDYPGSSHHRWCNEKADECE